MTKCMMCLKWFCFFSHLKGRSGYSTIGSHSRLCVDIMENKPSIQVELDTCENCSKLSTDRDEDKTAAMVSQAEIWQEDKKFTVPTLISLKKKITNCYYSV